jgi:hypothetical protein
MDGNEIDGNEISGNLSHSGHAGSENSGQAGSENSGHENLIKSRDIFGIVIDGKAIFGRDNLGSWGKEMFCGGSR